MDFLLARFRHFRVVMITNRTDRDLKLIKDFSVFARELGWRTVVYGGYGLDFFLGKITRDHGDIDLVFYGQNDRKSASKLISNFISKNLDAPTIEIEENDFQLVIDVHAKNLVLNLYYIQTQLDPYKNLHSVVKKSGEIVVNDSSMFPSPQKGSLYGFVVEVQDQSAHKKDILSKGSILSDKHKKDLDLIATLSPSI